MKFSLIFKNNFGCEGEGKGKDGMIMKDLDLSEGFINLASWDQVYDKQLTFELRTSKDAKFLEIIYLDAAKKNIAVLRMTYQGDWNLEATGTCRFKK